MIRVHSPQRLACFDWAESLAAERVTHDLKKTQVKLSRTYTTDNSGTLMRFRHALQLTRAATVLQMAWCQRAKHDVVRSGRAPCVCLPAFSNRRCNGNKLPFLSCGLHMGHMRSPTGSSRGRNKHPREGSLPIKTRVSRYRGCIASERVMYC